MSKKEGWRRVHVVVLCGLAAYAVIGAASAAYNYYQYVGFHRECVGLLEKVLGEGLTVREAGVFSKCDPYWRTVEQDKPLRLALALGNGARAFSPLVFYLLSYLLISYGLSPVVRWVRAGFERDKSGD